MASAQQWKLLKSRVQQIAERHLTEMEPVHRDEYWHLISKLYALCDSAAEYISSHKDQDIDNETELLLTDSFRTQIKYALIRDENSYRELKFILAIKDLDKYLDEIYQSLPFEVRAPAAMLARDAPIVRAKDLGIAQTEVAKRAEELSQNLKQIGAEVPIFKLGSFALYENKIQVSVTVLKTGLLQGTVYFPVGLLKRAGALIQKYWIEITKNKDFKRGQHSASLIFQDTVDRITSIVETLEISFEENGLYRVAARRVGHLSIDELVADDIRRGKAPPPEYAIKARKLDLRDAGLTTLSNLRDCVNLVHVDLDQNTELSDANLLSSLRKLEFVRVADTLLADVRFVEQLRFLKSFDVRGTKVVDLTPFKHCQNLSTLNIRATKVNDLKIVCSLGKIEYLNISLLKNLRNIECVTELKQLRRFDAAEVQNLTGKIISRLTQLELLVISEVPIDSVSWVTALPKLNHLIAIDCPITDWEILNKSNVTQLGIGFDQKDIVGKKITNKKIAIRLYEKGNLL